MYGEEALVPSVTRKKTYDLLMNKALVLFEQGEIPSISRLATEAGVSRATAYRYFPTQSDLIAAAVGASLETIREWKPKSEDKVGERIAELFDFAFPEMFRHEGALRAALLVSLQQWALERHSPDKMEKKLVRGNRKATLARVMEPVKEKYSPEMYRKVIAAFSLLYGSEVFLVMKDIWGMDNQQVIDNVQWMAKAIINQANSDSLEEGRAGQK
ncbi:DNA-binding transcriptional regulator, AcrR family [Phytobacter palmae]|nr:DNA-binding transcriptional regulator, AcrR family [Phytobacter palmae]